MKPAKYAGKCDRCGRHIGVGEEISFWKGAIRCAPCVDTHGDPVPEKFREGAEPPQPPVVRRNAIPLPPDPDARTEGPNGITRPVPALPATNGVPIWANVCCAHCGCALALAVKVRP